MSGSTRRIGIGLLAVALLGFFVFFTSTTTADGQSAGMEVRFPSTVIPGQPVTLAGTASEGCIEGSAEVGWDPVFVGSINPSTDPRSGSQVAVSVPNGPFSAEVPVPASAEGGWLYGLCETTNERGETLFWYTASPVGSGQVPPDDQDTGWRVQLPREITPGSPVTISGTTASGCLAGTVEAGWDPGWDTSGWPDDKDPRSGNQSAVSTTTGSFQVEVPIPSSADGGWLYVLCEFESLFGEEPNIGFTSGDVRMSTGAQNPSTTTTSPPPGSSDGDRLQISTLSASVRAPNEVSLELPVVATSALLALVLMLLMPFPAELFNQTLDQNYERVTAWWKRALGLRRAEVAGDDTAHSVWSLVVVAMAGGVLAGLLDPSFGLTLQSAAVFAGGMLAVTVVMGVSVGIQRFVLRRSEADIHIAVRALPGALVVGAACVMVSRLIGFQPGYLYGVLAGLIVVGVVAPRLEARAQAVAYGGLAVVSGVAWLAWWSIQQPQATTPGFGHVVFDTFLAAVFVAGLEALVIGLVPIRFLAGSAIFKWHRGVWAVMFGAGLFAFFLLLAHPGRGYGPTDSAVPFTTALALFVGFGLLSVGFWAWFRYREPRSRA